MDRETRFSFVFTFFTTPLIVDKQIASSSTLNIDRRTFSVEPVGTNK